jgi:hypothetical protein
VGARELEQVRQLLAAHPDWSRRRLSQQLTLLWDWRNGTGRLKDRADGTLHQAPIKEIYLCPLHPRFRERLQGQAAN